MRLAICIFGTIDEYSQNKINEVENKIRAKLQMKYHLDFFHDFSSDDLSVNLNNVCFKKITKEIEENLLYNICMAVNVNTDLLGKITENLNADDRLYYYRGGYARGTSVNLVSNELFYASGIIFNRACEFNYWVKPSYFNSSYEESAKNKNYNIGDMYFSYFLKTFKISYKCVYMTDRILFRGYT